MNRNKVNSHFPFIIITTIFILIPKMRSRLLCFNKEVSDWAILMLTIITSRVSGRGHRIGAVCVCVSVCLSALSRLNRLTYDLDFWYGS